MDLHKSLISCFLHWWRHHCIVEALLRRLLILLSGKSLLCWLLILLTCKTLLCWSCTILLLST